MSYYLISINVIKVSCFPLSFHIEQNTNKFKCPILILQTILNIGLLGKHLVKIYIAMMDFKGKKKKCPCTIGMENINT